jgi:hypothetical protein
VFRFGLVVIASTRWVIACVVSGFLGFSAPCRRRPRARRCPPFSSGANRDRPKDASRPTWGGSEGPHSFGPTTGQAPFATDVHQRLKQPSYPHSTPAFGQMVGETGFEPTFPDRHSASQIISTARRRACRATGSMRCSRKRSWFGLCTRIRTQGDAQPPSPSASSSRRTRSARPTDAEAPVPLPGTGVVRPSVKWWA